MSVHHLTGVRFAKANTHYNTNGANPVATADYICIYALDICCYSKRLANQTGYDPSNQGLWP